MGSLISILFLYSTITPKVITYLNFFVLKRVSWGTSPKAKEFCRCTKAFHNKLLRWLIYSTFHKVADSVSHYFAELRVSWIHLLCILPAKHTANDLNLQVFSPLNSSIILHITCP